MLDMIVLIYVWSWSRGNYVILGLSLGHRDKETRDNSVTFTDLSVDKIIYKCLVIFRACVVSATH